MPSQLEHRKSPFWVFAEADEAIVRLLQDKVEGKGEQLAHNKEEVFLARLVRAQMLGKQVEAQVLGMCTLHLCLRYVARAKHNGEVDPEEDLAEREDGQT